MNLPSAFASPPPRDLAQGAAVIRQLTQGLRTSAWIATLAPVVLMSIVVIAQLVKGRSIDLVEGLLCPSVVLLGLLGLPMWLWAWSNTRDIRRLYRDGVVVPGAVSGVSVGPSGTVWATVSFESPAGTAFTMRTNVLEAPCALAGITELPVLVDGQDPGVAFVIPPSQRLAAGRAKRE